VFAGSVGGRQRASYRPGVAAPPTRADRSPSWPGLANERDKSAGGRQVSNSKASCPCPTRRRGGGKVRTQRGIGGSFRGDITTERGAPCAGWRPAAQLARRTGHSRAAVITRYAVPLNDMMATEGELAQGAKTPARRATSVQGRSTRGAWEGPVSRAARASMTGVATRRQGPSQRRAEALVTARVAGQGAAATAFRKDRPPTPAEHGHLHPGSCPGRW